MYDEFIDEYYDLSADGHDEFEFDIDPPTEDPFFKFEIVYDFEEMLREEKEERERFMRAVPRTRFKGRRVLSKFNYWRPDARANSRGNMTKFLKRLVHRMVRRNERELIEEHLR